MNLEHECPACRVRVYYKGSEICECAGGAVHVCRPPRKPTDLYTSGELTVIVVGLLVLLGGFVVAMRAPNGLALAKAVLVMVAGWGVMRVGAA
jgi:hypothetical protein